MRLNRGKDAFERPAATRRNKIAKFFTDFLQHFYARQVTYLNATAALNVAS